SCRCTRHGDEICR
ncbi:flagellin D, partial [Vibrio parahaemolyticus AQ3810]